MTPTAPDRGRDKPLCGAQRRQEAGLCRRPAGWGTSHVGSGACKLHGGSTTAHRQAAVKAQTAAALAEAVKTYGLPVDVEPGEALLGLVRTSAGIVRWLGEQVAELQGATEVRYGGEGASTHKAHPLITLYLDERRELARVAKTTLDAGVAERRVRLAEAQGEVLVQVLQAFAGLLGHDPTDPAVRAAARQALLTIDGEAA